MIQGAREVPVVVQGTTRAALVIRELRSYRERSRHRKLEMEMGLEIHGTLKIQVTQVTQVHIRRISGGGRQI